MDVTSLHKAYASGQLTPEAVVEQIYARIDAEGLRPVWITLVPREQAIKRAKELLKNSGAEDISSTGEASADYPATTAGTRA